MHGYKNLFPIPNPKFSSLEAAIVLGICPSCDSFIYANLQVILSLIHSMAKSYHLLLFSLTLSSQQQANTVFFLTTTFHDLFG